MNPEKFTPSEIKKEMKLPTNIIEIKKYQKKFDNYELSKIEFEEREIFLKALELAKEKGNERKRFWNMLVTEVAKTPYQPPQDRQTQVLDIGCGKCNEADILSAYFGCGNFGFNSENVKVTGIDIDKKAIEKAIKNCQKPDFSESITKYILPSNFTSNFEFIHGDATKLNQYSSISDKIDVVVIRHQKISDNEKLWTKIFQEALHKLNQEGIMILTSFSDIEHEMLIKKLQELNCEILINESNPYAKSLKTPGVSIDKNIAIIKRKET
jgi:SAM-dependent methyltransferase